MCVCMYLFTNFSYISVNAGYNFSSFCCQSRVQFRKTLKTQINGSLCDIQACLKAEEMWMHVIHGIKFALLQLL